MHAPAHVIERRPNETVIQIIHRHWFNIAAHFFILTCIVVFVLLGFIILPSVSEITALPVQSTLLNFFESLALIFLWMYGFLLWIDYYFDVWIITNERIINIEQKGLFKRTVSELDLTRIQDVTTDVSGLIPTFLNFGDVYVQTAGEHRRFVFRTIPFPNACKNEIMHLVKKLPQ